MHRFNVAIWSPQQSISFVTSIYCLLKKSWSQGPEKLIKSDKAK